MTALSVLADVFTIVKDVLGVVVDLGFKGLIGFVVGAVVATLVPAIYNWIKKQVTSVEKDVPVVANTVVSTVTSAVVNTASKVV